MTTERVEAPGAVSLERIADEVCLQCGIGIRDLREASRRRPMALARFVMIKLAREAGFSTPRIGAFLGGRDHTTVCHGERRFRGWLNGSDEAYARSHVSLYRAARAVLVSEGFVMSERKPEPPRGGRLIRGDAALTERVRRMWSAGFSAAAIARAEGLDKHVVDGWIFRAGLRRYDGRGQTAPVTLAPRVKRADEVE